MSGHLTHLTAGMAIPFGGDRFATERLRDRVGDRRRRRDREMAEHL